MARRTIFNATFCYRNVLKCFKKPETFLNKFLTLPLKSTRVTNCCCNNVAFKANISPGL